MKVLSYKALGSTNLKAKELAKQNEEPWTVVLAEKQTTGYGRKKTPWFSPEGGLYFSVILPKSKVEEGRTFSPPFAAAREIEDLQTITISAAFIVAKVLKENFSLEPLIKLPNDVLINSKKIAGILTENVIGENVKLSVMGVGLNTNIEKFPKELENIATSLKIELGREVDNKKILEQIIEGFKKQLKTISE